MLKIIPLGGMTVTKNLFVYETDKEILLIDCGIGFPDESMFGVDLLIPDISYLEKNKKPIIGMILTHGHDDHIGGLPYILPKLPDFPIFASKLTAGFAKDRMEEFGINRKINEFDDVRGIRLGGFSIESVKVTHSVPDTRHFAISTNQLTIYHGSDYKFDLMPIDDIKPDFQKIAGIGSRGVTLMLTDCLHSERPGYSLSESSVGESIREQIRTTKGKVIVTVMSSSIHRIQQIINIAQEYNRKVALVGRSIESNAKTANSLDFLNLPEKSMMNKKKIHKLPDREQCLIVAGSQGQAGSSLVRIAQQEYQNIKIENQDRVIIASDIIPGNERAVYETIDAFAHLGAEVVYTDIEDDLHASGHAYSQEMMLLMELVKAKYILPIGGNYRHIIQYRNLAEKLGYQKESIFVLDDGQSIEIDNFKNTRIGKTVALKNIMVDGLGIGDVGRIVLRDRKKMAEEGMLVAIIPLDVHTGKITDSIEIISRGFVYIKQSKELINKAKQEIRNSIKGTKTPITEWNSLKEKIKDNLEKMLYEELERLPMVIPIIIRV